MDVPVDDRVGAAQGWARMRFQNEIEVAAPPDELFAFVSDVERVAPCLPGAAIDGRDGDEYQGSMKVKVGPITGTYKGKMRFVERDEEARRAVMSARAAEVNGQGDAEATITTQIEEAGEGSSRIRMDTDLQIRGRVAQFGRGAMEKISQRMFDEFARNLEQEMTGGDGEEAPAPDAAQDGEARPDRSRPRPRRPRPPKASRSTRWGCSSRRSRRRRCRCSGRRSVGFGYGYLLGRLRELRR